VSGGAYDFAAMTLGDFCAALAAKTPAPGGGAVAGVTVAHAAALLAMVVEYSRGKKAFAAREPEGEAIRAALGTAIQAALAAAKADADAYATLNALWRLPEGDPMRRDGWEAAVRGAIAAPMLIVRIAAEVAGRAADLVGSTARHLDSDLIIAADLASAGAGAAAWNVRVNLPAVLDPEERARAAASLEAALAAVRADREAVERGLALRTPTL
jgi:formiminotetrahydrofolate cyclodeaminase